MFRVPGSTLVLLGVLHVAAVLAADEPRFRLKPLAASGLIPYHVAEAVEGSRFRPGDGQLVVWALEEWTRNAAGALRFERVENRDAARLRFVWLPWAEDGSMGRMEPSTESGKSIASISIRPDEERFRPSIRRRIREDPLLRDVVLYFVCLHEIGHSLGLSHSHNPRDVMWPGANGVTLPVYERYRHRLRTRDDIPRMSWLSTDDVGRLREIWPAKTLPE